MHSPYAPPSHPPRLPTHMHAHPSSMHSPFSSPALSASSSPYISPSLPSSNSSVSSLSGLALGATASADGPAAAASLTSSSSSSPSSSHPSASSSIEGMLLIGSRVRVRGVEFVHPKLSSYAHTAGEIVALPAHPNTWFGVRLHDGRVVKLRKSAFDVVSLYPSHHAHAAGGGATAHHQPYHHSQLYSPYAFSHYQQQQQSSAQPHYTVTPFPSHQPYSHIQAQAQQPAQQQAHSSAARLHQQLMYSSPSPVSSPSPSPTLSTAGSVPTHSPPALALDHASYSRAHHHVAPVPTVAPSSIGIDSGAAHTQAIHPQLASRNVAASRLEADRSPPLHVSDEGDAQMLSGSEDLSDVRGHPEHEHDAAPSDRSRPPAGPRVRAPPDSDLVLHSKRKPVPRLMSPEAEEEEEEEEEENEELDGDADGDELPYDDDEDDTYSRTSSKKSPRHRPVSTPTRKSGGSAKSTPSKGHAPASASKPARSRRGRGRALLGLNVVITGGRYKGDTGLVVRGANGYYCVKFHRPIAELRQHDNTAMKRSSELAPITAQGKRLVLPLPPAQRKLMKAQAAAGVGPAAAAVAMSSVQRENLPRGTSPNPSHKRKLAFPAPSRRSAVHRRRGDSASRPDGSPRDDESDLSSQSGGRSRDDDGRSSRSRSPSVDSRSHTDEEQFDDEQVGLLYSSGDDGAPDRSERHWVSRRRSSSGASSCSSCSRSSSCMSSPSRSSGMSGAGAESPTQTELLSPASYPASPSAAFTLTQTPITLSHSIPPSPSTLHHPQSAFLAPMSLPPAHSPGGVPDFKSASMRAESPRVKQAACILLALSHEGLVVSPHTLESSGALDAHQLGIQGEPVQLTYSLTHIKPTHQTGAHDAFRHEAHSTPTSRTA